MASITNVSTGVHGVLHAQAVMAQGRNSNIVATVRWILKCLLRIIATVRSRYSSENLQCC